MSEKNREAEELAQLLGPVPEVSVPPMLDQRVHAMGRMLAGRLGQERECPAAFVWAAVVEIGVVLVVAASRLMEVPLLAPEAVPVWIYIGAGLNLLALLLSPLILLPARWRNRP